MDSISKSLAEDIAEYILAKLNSHDVRYTEQVWTVSEYAKRMRVNRTKVLDWIDAGQLKAVNISEGTKRPRWRIRSADANDFENSRMKHVERPRRRRRLRRKTRSNIAAEINGSMKPKNSQ